MVSALVSSLRLLLMNSTAGHQALSLVTQETASFLGTFGCILSALVDLHMTSLLN